MAGFDHSVLTDIGWDALTDAEAGQHIEYTHLEAGDGYVYGGDTEIYGMTELKNKVMDFPITNFSNDGQGQITLIGVISSKNVATGFNFREIGVRCTIDGGPSILYAVANSGDEADYIPSSAESGVVIQTVQIVIKIDRATNVTVIIAPGLDVTAQNIGPGTVGPGWFRDKQGQILWFKRINSPKKTLTISETPDIVSIDVPVIDQNLDMWVALGNPDVFPHFSTIQKALNYLVPITINPGIFVTINVAAGTWSGYPMTTVNHPQGSQIKIIGTAGAVKNVTTVTGNASALNLNGPAGTFNDMAVGDYFFYKNLVSTTSRILSGMRQVTAKAVDGSQISFEPNWWGTFPNIGGLTGGTVTPIQTVHKATSKNATFMEVKGDGLGLLKNMIWVGGPIADDPGSKGMWAFAALSGTTTLERCGAYKWYCASASRVVGIGCKQTGYVECLECSAIECGTGMCPSGIGAQMFCNDCYACSNEYAGFRSLGQMHIDFGASCGCKSTGMESSQNGILGFDGVASMYNQGYGLLCWLNSYADGSNKGTASNILTANSVRDVHVAVTSTVVRATGLVMLYGTANIAPNSLSADGCYFTP